MGVRGDPMKMIRLGVSLVALVLAGCAVDGTGSPTAADPGTAPETVKGYYCSVTAQAPIASGGAIFYSRDTYTCPSTGGGITGVCLAWAAYPGGPKTEIVETCQREQPMAAGTSGTKYGYAFVNPVHGRYYYSIAKIDHLALEASSTYTYYP
jgi:hypothetical protein